MTISEQKTFTSNDTIDSLFLKSESFFNVNKYIDKSYDGTPYYEEFMLPPSDLCPIFDASIQHIHFLLKKHDVQMKKVGGRYYIPSPQVRRILEIYSFKYTPEIISFICTKGGVGKTTSSYTLAIRFNQFGAKVLVVDTDHQANTTNSFSIDGEKHYCMMDVISDSVSIGNAIVQVTPSLHIIPSNLENSGLEKYIHLNHPRSDILIKDLFSKILETYDYVIIDCSPALGILNSSVLAASNRIILPVNPNQFSISGAANTLKWIRDITVLFKSKRDTKLNILINRAKSSKSTDEFISSLKKSDLFGDFVLDSYIRENEYISKKLNQSESVFSKSLKMPGREDFDMLARELMGLKYPLSTSAQKDK